MKKLITLLLILALILPAAACAEMNELTLPDWPDLSVYTDEQLIILSRQIQQLLFDRKLADGVDVPMGRYTVGEDIPAGSYRIVTSTDSGAIFIYSKEGQTINSYLIGSMFDALEIGKITLEAGQVFDLTYCNIKMYPYVGLFN